MILVFEQDTRAREGKRFSWKPVAYRGCWQGKRMWRIGWGLWSLSYYPSPGLRDFCTHIESGKAQWRNQ